jgi:transposase InsO family protein
MMSLQGGLTIERMCGLARVSRAGFYRWLTVEAPREEEMEVRAAIHAVALEHRGRYGYRRVSRELRRRGLVVNHKRVARLMREDNLLAVQPRAWVQTTDSDHELKVYLNLAARMQLTGINQLWVADITYIRLRAEFVYLAVVLDAWSRKVVGWALGRSLAAQLTVSALEKAIAERQPLPGASLRSRQSVCLPGVCRPA